MSVRSAANVGHRRRAELPARRLVIRGGSHDSAVLDLAEGAYLIGSADHCQIVLRDQDVAGEQALLCLSSTGSFLRTLAEPMSHRGRTLNRNEVVACDQDTVIAIGDGLHIGVVQNSTDIRSIDWTEDESDAHAASPQVKAKRTLSDPVSAREVKSSGAVRAFGINTVAAATLVLFGIGLAIVTTSNARDPAQSATHRSTAVQQALVGALGQRAANELQVETANDGTVLVQGYAPSVMLLQQARARIDSPDVRWSVHSVDEVIRYASDWLTAKGIQADVRYQGAGSLEVVVDPQVLPKAQGLLTQLRAEVPGLRSVVAQTDLHSAPKDATRTARVDSDAVSTIATAAPARAGEGPLVLSGFSGVNAAAQLPYITSGSTYIFRGGTLNNGMSVREISSASVVVGDQASRRTHLVMVR